MALTFKIPQSVLVVIYTLQWDVLLIRRADGGDGEQAFWQSVTGSKDAEDENWSTTAAREVWEETGIDCRPGGPWADCLRDWQLENVYTIYPRWLHRYAPGVSHNVERLFGLRLPHRLPIHLAPLEHTAFKWLPLSQAADACFSPSNAEAILCARSWALNEPFKSMP
ncbi:MAG: dihydroneopterin triphosphate diphosphatase [Burkholderiales bacterium PBB4]|nr:MAG: dihydroneopterin triphosphate diphosphatase [Burkholderiales bacterium PBB4]